MHHYDQRKHIIGYIYNDSQLVFQKKIGQLGGYEYSSKAKKKQQKLYTCRWKRKCSTIPVL